MRINLSPLRKDWDTGRINRKQNKLLGDFILGKHTYQTCLRMPITLKQDMTTICDEYHINESDLMRKAIVQFIENIKQNPDQTSPYMFV